MISLVVLFVVVVVVAVVIVVVVVAAVVPGGRLGDDPGDLAVDHRPSACLLASCRDIDREREIDI